MGLVGKGRFVLRGHWDGRSQSAFWDATPAVGIEWQLHPVTGGCAVFVTPALPTDGIVTLPGTDVFPTAMEFGSPGWLAPFAPLAITIDEVRHIWVLTRDSLSVHSIDGRVSATHSIPAPLPDDAACRMLAHVGHAYATWGSSILTYSPIHGIRLEPLERPVRRLAMFHQL